MSELEQIRNFGIIAHIDAGKTTTTERMLYYSGKTHRLGEVDDGTAIMDYLDEERQRGITIISAAAAFPWQDCRLHLIDTPGHIDFTAEVERSLRVIDGAVVIFSGVEGVEAQSETVWRQADHYHLPRLAFINKLDRLGASFDRVCAEINDKFDHKALILQVPVGIEQNFNALIDLVACRRLTFEGEDGETVAETEIPAELADQATATRRELIERLADFSDPVAELYLADEEIPTELLRREIRRLTLENVIVPVLAGAAKRNLGVQPLLDAVVAYLPSPADVGAVTGISLKTGAEVQMPPAPDAPFSGLVFKVKANPSADLYYLRTYSGVLKTGANVFVPRTGDTVRIKRILRIYAQRTEALDKVGPGDIVGFLGPRNIVTGDTLCERNRALTYERMTFPEPVISMALEPKSSQDRDKLDESLALICREDPTLTLSRDENTGQRILAGMGELHLEINVHRLAADFHLGVKCGEPRVAYRETVQTPVETHTQFHKVLGDQELFAGVRIALRPEPNPEQPFRVENKVRGREVGKNLIQAALQALTDGLKTGGNYGYPLTYIAAELLELETQRDKTTEGAVLGAVLQALDQAIREAGTVILEPIMKLEILAPEEHLGEISNDIQSRRGLILDVTSVSRLKRTLCEVPLAEMFGFSKAIPKLTGGRGAFTMEPCGYKPVQT